MWATNRELYTKYAYFSYKLSWKLPVNELCLLLSMFMPVVHIIVSMYIFSYYINRWYMVQKELFL